MKPQFENIARVLAAGIVLALGTGSAAWAQSAKLNLDGLSKLADKADEVVDVTLDGPMLKFAEKFMQSDKDDDAEALRVIKGLTGVYVKSFEFKKPGQYSEADLEAIRAQLKGSAWSRFVNVTSKREGEKDEVYLMPDPSGKGNLGLAIIVAEPDELTVVNIVGPIDVEHLADLEGKMGVPDLDLKTRKHGGRHDPN
ncbi:MAG TPA: DUF4252 domain-containing protein [Terriglobia bacterium]|nr:DUF4252 domain-containing protein [Terriglobia bacterium]